MVFKWFKARMTMNRMPANSSAVPGSYKTMTFDTSDGISNYNRGRVNGQIKTEQKSTITRPVSLPVLNNPMAGIGDADNDLDDLTPSKNGSSRESSVSVREKSKLDQRAVYSGSNIENPVLEALSQDYSKNIGKETPKSALKLHNADYKKKKVKAPAPKIRSTTSSANTLSANQSAGFVTVKNDRKTSQPSDIDV